MQLLIARLTARLRRCQGSQCLWSLFPRVGHHRGRQGAPRTAPETCGQPSGQERAHERARHLPVLCHFFVSVNCPRGGQPSRYLLCKGAAAVDQTRRQRQLVVVAKLRELPGTTGRDVGGGQFDRPSIVLAWSDLPWRPAWPWMRSGLNRKRNETKRAVEFGSWTGRQGLGQCPLVSEGTSRSAKNLRVVPYCV